MALAPITPFCPSVSSRVNTALFFTALILALFAVIGARRHLSYAVAGALGGVSALLLSFTIVQWLSLREVAQAIALAASTAIAAQNAAAARRREVVCSIKNTGVCFKRGVSSDVIEFSVIPHLDGVSLLALLFLNRGFYAKHTSFLQRWHHTTYGKPLPVNITRELFLLRAEGRWDRLLSTLIPTRYDYALVEGIKKYAHDVNQEGAIVIAGLLGSQVATHLLSGNYLIKHSVRTVDAQDEATLTVKTSRTRVSVQYCSKEVEMWDTRDPKLTAGEGIGSAGSSIELPDLDWAIEKRMGWKDLTLDWKTLLLIYTKNSKTVKEVEIGNLIKGETQDGIFLHNYSIESEGSQIFLRVNNVLFIMDLNEEHPEFKERVELRMPPSLAAHSIYDEVGFCAISRGWVAYVPWGHNTLCLYHWQSRQFVSRPLPDNYRSYYVKNVRFIKEGIALTHIPRGESHIQLLTLKFW